MQARAASSGTWLRIPSIKFRYGKRDGAAPQKAIGTPAAVKQTALPLSDVGGAVGLSAPPPSRATKTYLDLPPAFGRPLVTDAEARAIESGGAYY